MNPNVQSNLVTLDGKGEFTVNTKLRNPDEKPDPKLITGLIRECIGENIDIEFLGYNFFPTTARFSIIWERGSPSFIFMESITPALWQALIWPDQHIAWRGDRLPDNCDELLAFLTGW